MHSSPRKPFQASFYLYVLLMEKRIVIHIYRLGTCRATDFFFLCKTQAFQTIGGVKRFLIILKLAVRFHLC